MTGADADDRARLVGINHVALEVGDIAAAVEWYRTLFACELRGRSEGMAFLDMGDQFLALSASDDVPAPGHHRHVGLVVDDRAAVERRLAAVDADRLDTDGLDLRDPWGNRLQIVEYGEIQFTKAAHVLAGMGVAGEKTEAARAELEAKGMAPETTNEE